MELKGLTIGISLRTVYNFTAEGRSYKEDHSTEELLEKGKEYAGTILKRLRERDELKNVPIVFALYEEEEASSKIPGQFMSKTMVKGSSSSIGDWKDINEKHVLFLRRKRRMTTLKIRRSFLISEKMYPITSRTS